MSGALRTGALTAGALAAFAANSILCRLALRAGEIDAASFTAIRLSSGAVMLAVLALATRRSAIGPAPRRVLPAAMLFAYAIAFSLAYLELPAGTGALILFGSVQLTMLAIALRGGERLRVAQTIGGALALAGLAWLVSPGIAAPAPKGAALMALAGVAWGVYSLLGRGSGDAIAATTRNFVLALPLAAVTALAGSHASLRGIALAVASGAIASGLGYVVWYAALRGLRATQAAFVQLAVPLIAAVAGVVFLDETVGVRLVGSGVVILGGIALAMLTTRSK